LWERQHETLEVVNEHEEDWVDPCWAVEVDWTLLDGVCLCARLEGAVEEAVRVLGSR
jgi:hypothetical protein